MLYTIHIYLKGDGSLTDDIDPLLYSEVTLKILKNLKKITLNSKGIWMFANLVNIKINSVKCLSMRLWLFAFFNAKQYAGCGWNQQNRIGKND